MDELVTWFRELPRYLQFLIVIGFLTPFLILRSYLNPPPPPRRPDGSVILPDGTEGEVYLNRDQD